MSRSRDAQYSDPAPRMINPMTISTGTQPLAEQLRSRLQLRSARVGVVGLGYVGLPLAETFAWGGYSVLGFDVDASKIEKLKRGESYIGHLVGTDGRTRRH